MDSGIPDQKHTEVIFKETDKLLCSICLTTNKDNNITDSTCYVEIYNHLLSENAFVIDTSPKKKLFLCMWCKSLVKKMLALKRLALASEKIIYNQQFISVNTHQQTPHIPSISKISHIDVLTDLKCMDTAQDYGDQIKQKHILNNIVNINEANTEIECNNYNEITAPKLNENYNELDNYEIDIDENNENGLEISTCHLVFEENENKTHKKKYISKECDVPSKIRVEKRKKKKKVKSQRKNIELKSEELQFKVRYLDLEEQHKQIERKKIKVKNMKFQCDICGKGFLTNDYFEEHNLRHTEFAGTYKCSLCKLHFKTQRVFSQHVLLHRRQFICLLCGVTFSKWSNCSVHRYKCGISVVFCQCVVCSKSFSDEYSLKIHMRVHNLNKNYTCDHCKKKFKTKQRLIVHIRIHTGEKPFTCEHCSRSFSAHSNLKAHYEVHSKGSRHYCVECDTYYSSSRGLKRHLKESFRHTRERNERFSCKECPKKFSTSNLLQHHLTRHTKEKHVKCEQCNKTLSNKSNLRKHMKLQHHVANKSPS